MNVIDLFSGVGGFSSGFKQDGYDVLLANEIDESIARSYQLNHLDTLMINKDIKEFAEHTEQIIETALRAFEDQQRADYIREMLGDIDVIIGGPPCQGFSMAGSRIRKSTSFIEDERNYLFKYYFKLIQKFEPNYFVMENVQGLETMKNGAILEEIMNLFQDENNFIGGPYSVSKIIVAANELGVPQGRKRLILIGSKNGCINIAHELELAKQELKIPAKVTIEEAISDLNYLESGQGSFETDYQLDIQSEYQRARRAGSTGLFNHIAPKHNEVALERIRKIKQGENFTVLRDEDIKSVHSGAYGRLEWAGQSATITTRFDTPSAGRVIHPGLNRALTPREAARIQSFDDSFIFYGNKTSVGKQIGNAVPPLVARVLAHIIRKDYNKHYR